MNIEKYRTFLICAKSRTFLNAANVLYTTPSTVTKHIAALEKELGVALFTRTPSGISLTEEGHRRLPLIEQLVSSYDRLQNFKTDAAASNSLHLYSIPLPDRFHLNGLLHAFQEKNPSVLCTIEETHALVDALVKGIYRMGFVHYSSVVEEKLDYIRFEAGKKGIVLAKQHPLAQKASLSVADLADEKFVDMAVGYTFRANEEYFHRSGITYRPLQLFQREDSMLLFLMEHPNMVCICSSAIIDFYQISDLTFIPFSDHSISYGALARPKDLCLRSVEKAFWDFAEKYYAAASAGSIPPHRSP